MDKKTIDIKAELLTLAQQWLEETQKISKIIHGNEPQKEDFNILVERLICKQKCIMELIKIIEKY